MDASLRPAANLHHRVAWHALAAEEALRQVGGAPLGLSDSEAAERLVKNGPNRLSTLRRRGSIARFVRHLHNGSSYFLLVVAVGAGVLGEWLMTAVTIAVAMFRAAAAFAREGDRLAALWAIDQLRAMSALVWRSGRLVARPVDELVLGDVVSLTAGDLVPADLRILGADNLQLQELALTGTAEPVAKHGRPVARETPLAERSSMAYSGSLVIGGEGVGVVVATGERTELGDIRRMLVEVQELLPASMGKTAVDARWVAAANLALRGRS